MRTLLRGLGAFALLLLLLLSASAASAAEPAVIGADEVQALLARDRTALVVDERSADEYADAHLPRAVHIPAAEVRSSGARLPRDRKAAIVFYCRGMG